MNGSVPSRWSRLVRVLRPTAVVVALSFVLQSCGGNPAPDTAPKPADNAGAQPSQPAPAPAPAPAPTPAPAPDPTPVATTPAPPPAPVVKDTAALALAFCQQVTADVKAAIADTTMTEPDSIVRKVVNGMPDSLTTMAMIKGERCKKP